MISLIKFIRLTKNHTGEYLAEELEKCFRSFGIEKNVSPFHYLIHGLHTYTPRARLLDRPATMPRTTTPCYPRSKLVFQRVPVDFTLVFVVSDTYSIWWSRYVS